MDIDEAITQLSIDISVVLKDKQLEAIKCFCYFFLFRFASVAKEAFVGAFFLPLEEDNTEAYTCMQQDIGFLYTANFWSSL